MHYKRIIPCLDVRNGKLTKGIKFQDNIDIGDPVTAAKTYEQDGADELVFYDITASSEGRSIFLDVVKSVANVISLPFCVGGGIRSLEDMHAVFAAGAHKVSINSSAVLTPTLIHQGAQEFGSAALTVAMDVKQVPASDTIPSGYEIVIQGGRKHMGIDAIAWSIRCAELGAGELCVNSIDADGTKEGYDLTLTSSIAQASSLPIIASGGAGTAEHLLQALTTGKADAALVASIVHYGDYTIATLKDYLHKHGCPVHMG